MDSIIGPIQDTWQTLRRMNIRTFLSQTVQLGLIISSALIIWKSLMLVTRSESPVVFVLSGGMEPGFYRGDILFLNMGTKPLSQDRRNCSFQYRRERTSSCKEAFKLGISHREYSD
ncbi:hypothetical protein CEUSTIGMA_g11523.t1 [Chlamydomonas eustigma]|uniref:Signal peptidase complex catalytic subunit SEC11 n=1 Tax=Chlamydomonas eustigma TaxID=1157962 RepID=A0A250XMS6_9CHLO|nr:hypothetical protein CEUSTIGMA_g11523.t1 [Chlamydomonas eustigma]|eukprot:GAX84100.1 hypothetical protein CEUSTIGMA_g11523.t1 [Chlamydomonas eustigma]